MQPLATPPSSLVNVTTASGTNAIHGDAHWALRHSALDAPSFFQNRNNVRKPVYRDNRYGASAGGPIVLPKLYNGKNGPFGTTPGKRTSGGLRSRSPARYRPKRSGKAISRRFFVGPQYQTYNPATAVLTADGRVERKPFAGNLIPRNRLDFVGVALAALYPPPNQVGTADGRNDCFNGGLVALQD